MRDDQDDLARQGSRTPSSNAILSMCTSGALGVALWMGLMAGPVHEIRMLPFAVLGSVAAFAIGWFWGQRAWKTGIGIVMGPLLLAPLTASRGDGDGTWVFQFVFLGIFAALCVMLAWIGRRIRGTRRAMRTPGLAWQLVPTGMSVFGAVLLTMVMWPNPWSALEGELNRFELSGFKTVETARAGSALCWRACSPNIYRVVSTSSLVDIDACGLLEKAFEDAGVGITSASTCHVVGELRGGPFKRLLVTGYRVDGPVAGKTVYLQISLEATE